MWHQSEESIVSAAPYGAGIRLAADSKRHGININI